MPVSITGNPKNEKVDLIACPNIEDVDTSALPPGSEIISCRGCGAKVYLAETSPRGVPALCYPCASVLVRASGKEPDILLTKSQYDVVDGSLASKINTMLNAAKKGP